MSTVWVLGGHGFIGQEVVKLLKNKYKVITTSQSSLQSPHEGVIHYNIKYEYNHFRDVLSQHKIDSILFLSGNAYPANSEHTPFYEIESTYLPFLALTEAVRLHSTFSRVWFASSVAVYGANNEPSLGEESETCPLSFYGLAKLNLEEYVKYYARVHKLSMGAFRIFSTYGPTLKRQLIYDLVQKMIRNPELISVYGDGTEARDLSFVTDQAAAICTLVEKVNPNGDIYNVGSGQLYTVNEVIERLVGILKIKPKIDYIPKRSFDGTTWKADITKMNTLGFKQKYNLQQGLEQTVSGILKES
ncbi:MAG: NAD-dependent epimerase/dehydratase family protein [Bdellovibrionaceae bacterium]|nr:NAD-dependent epimerase/dehydratase family protein [Bdellovibrio sp.]